MVADVCPGCGAKPGPVEFFLKDQPAVLNYRFASQDAARRVARGVIALVQCPRCRLVFNSAFDGEKVPYDRGYENSQASSLTFKSHLRRLAHDLVKRNRLSQGRILEIG